MYENYVMAYPEDDKIFHKIFQEKSPSDYLMVKFPKHQIEPLIRNTERSILKYNMRSKQERRYLSLLVKHSKLGLMEVDAEHRLRLIKMAQKDVEEELEELKKQGISLNTIR